MSKAVEPTESRTICDKCAERYKIKHRYFASNLRSFSEAGVNCDCCGLEVGGADIGMTLAECEMMREIVKLKDSLQTIRGVIRSLK